MKLNYFNYFTEIELFFQSKRESFTLLSTLDWVLMESWKEQGIPLEVVLKGIDRAFGRARRKVNSLAYCIRAVSEVVEEEKETRIEAPGLPDFSSDETRRYLEGLAEKVSSLAGTFPEFGSRFALLSENVRAVDTSDFKEAEQVLTALEERLIAILKVASGDSDLLDVKRSVDSDLNPFRSTMTAEQLAMLEQQLWRRKMLEKYGAPRLSLFYLI